ncbi:MAG: hypothetical protein NTW52_03910 [Planctomycetota bacterium]|nr:hypothetical protein [Planctomycetota bacterium]
MALATGFDFATVCHAAPEASAYGSGKMPPPTGTVPWWEDKS